MNEQSRYPAQVVIAKPGSDGSGVKLKRVLNPQQVAAFDPFLLLDEFGSDNPDDYQGGFPEHPHRGFETVTYMLAGALRHRDHLGNQGHLTAGDVQWMTAARGIIHSEMPEQEHGLLHGFQLWLNLPAADKMKPPHYQDFAATEIPVIELAAGGCVKVIAGHYQSADGIVVGAVTGAATQPVFLDVLLAARQSLSLPVNPLHTAMIYVYQGELTIGDKEQPLASGQLARLVNGNRLVFKATDKPSRCLVFTAMPIAEPVVQSGPFVMNTAEEIAQAYQDYRNGLLTQ